MAEPKFTPLWRGLGLLTPFIAVGVPCLVAYAQSGSNLDENNVTLIALTLFGAGNALLIGMAIGDIGRTLLGVFASALAALICAKTLNASIYLVGPLVVTAAWAACFGMKLTLESILNAMVTALIYLLQGALVSLILFAGVGCLVLIFIWARLVALAELTLVIGAMLAVGYANMNFMRKLFKASLRVSRVEPEREKPMDKEAPADEG